MTEEFLKLYELNLKQLRNQQIWSAIGGIASLLVSSSTIISFLTRTNKPNLAVQILNKKKQIKLASLQHKNDLELLNMRYQHQMAKLNLEQENLHQQAKLFNMQGNLESGSLVKANKGWFGNLANFFSPENHGQLWKEGIDQLKSETNKIIPDVKKITDPWKEKANEESKQDLNKEKAN